MFCYFLNLYQHTCEHDVKQVLAAHDRGDAVHAHISVELQQPWLQGTIDSLSLSKEWKIFIRSPFTTWSHTASQQSEFMLDPRHGM